MKSRLLPPLFAAFLFTSFLPSSALAAGEALVSISDASVTESNAGEVSLQATISASAANGRDISVSYTTVAQSASAGSDFLASSGTVTLDKRTPSATISVAVIGDLLYEPTETLLLVLSQPSGGAVILDGEGVATILNDDPLPSISIADGSGLEGEPSNPGSATLNVVLSSPSASAVSVDYQVIHGTAGAQDLNAASGSASFAPGALVTSISVAFIGDEIDEVDETFQVQLGTATGAEIVDGQAVGAILDDDPEPTLAVADVAIAEGNSGAKVARFTVTLSGESAKTVSVSYATAAGTASPGSDFGTASGTLSFPTGTTSRTVDITVNTDVTYEPDETFFVDLSSPLVARIADGRAEGRILNDDPIPSISVDDYTVREQAFPRSFTFDAYLSNPSSQPVTVAFATRDGTAIAPQDYVSAQGTLSFSPGQTYLSIDVLSQDDGIEEATEVMYFDLADAQGGTFRDATGVGTIIDNEGLWIGPFDDTSYEGDTITKQVSLEGTYNTIVTVDYKLTNYFSGAPYDCLDCSGKLVFLPGESNKTISYRTADDSDCDEFTVIRFTLSANVNARLNAPSYALAGVYDPDCWQ